MLSYIYIYIYVDGGFVFVGWTKLLCSTVDTIGKVAVVCIFDGCCCVVVW